MSLQSFERKYSPSFYEITISTDMILFCKVRRLLLHVAVKWCLCSRHVNFKESWPSAMAWILQFLHCWTQLHCLHYCSAALSATQSIRSLQQILSYKCWYNKLRRFIKKVVISFIVLHLPYKSLIFRKYSVVFRGGWVNRILKIISSILQQIHDNTSCPCKLQAGIQTASEEKLYKVIWLIFWKCKPVPSLSSAWHNTVT